MRDSHLNSTKNTGIQLCFAAPLPPPIGGICTWSEIVINSLHLHGLEYPLVVNISPSCKRLNAKGAITKIAFLWKDNRKYMRAFREAIRANHIDVLHLATSGGLGFLRDLGLISIARKNKIPTCCHIHYGKVPEVLKRKGLVSFWARKTFELADGIIAIDRKTFQALQQDYGNKSYLVPNPIDVSSMIPSAAKFKTVLFVGHIVQNKGIKELLNAWGSINDHQGWTLKLIGPCDDSFRAELVNAYDFKDVELIGAVGHNTVLSEMANASVFVLPSYSEGCPNVILEAMLESCAIIATKVGAIPEMLEDDSGILIEPFNVLELRAALINLMQSREMQMKLGAAAFARVSQRYSCDRVFHRYFEIWKQLALTSTKRPK